MMDTTPPQGTKMSLESLSKEEIIQKYKGLLGIAKKAKQAKDEIAEENRILKEQLQEHETQKEADKKALLTMKEMLEVYTENKLQLTTQVTELQKQRKLDQENLDKLTIENESLKRQLQRLTEDNESLLTDIENMESQLKQVSGLTKEQKQCIKALENENNQLKENNTECNDAQKKVDELNRELEEVKEKYKFIKDINTEQRNRFNSLKDRFIEVHKKVKTLKECKRILLETQHEYADSVSQWQNEIIKASKVLCKELNDLKDENNKLLQKLGREQLTHTNLVSIDKLNELLFLSEKAKTDYLLLLEENVKLKQNLGNSIVRPSSSIGISSKRLNEIWTLSKTALQEYRAIQEENFKLKSTYADVPDKKNLYSNNVFESKIGSKLEELLTLVKRANEDYQKQKLELDQIKEENAQLKNKVLNDDNGGKSKTLQTVDSQKENQLLLHQIQPLQQENKIFETLSCENMELKNKLQELTISISEPKDEIISTTQSSEEYQEMYKQKEIEHLELLAEMRELNEALKTRGDHISRQQEEYQKLQNEFKKNSNLISQIQEELNRKDNELNDKQRKLKSLMEEMTQTKIKLEALECSSALNEDKVRVLSTELENLKSNASNANDFDNQSDILSTSTISRAEEMQRLKDVEDSFEDKYNKLRALAAKLKKKLQEETTTKQSLEKEIIELKSRENEMGTELTELKQKVSHLDILQNQFKEKQKQIDNLKNENQKLKSSRKQANVLNLEIEAAEKSLTEVTNKLTSRTSELDAAQESIKSKDSTIIQLRKEIELLETSKAAEIKHSQELKQQIDHLHKTLRDEMHSKQQAYDKSKILEQDVENLKLELENVKMELAQSTSIQEAALETLKNEGAQLSEQLTLANAALAATEQKLRIAESATNDLRVEYLDYKVKAQTVLKKNQTRDSTKERELEEELIAIRATEVRLNTTIQTLSTIIETLEKQRDNLADENVSLQKRLEELMALVEDTRTQNESLNREVQQYIQQQHETLKQHRKQIESMDKCHKEQVQSLNASHQRQLDQLRSELSSKVRLPPNAKSLTNIDNSIEIGKLDLFLMEREDAEGSEEAAETLANLAASRKISNDSSSVKRSVHDFMPLDELLNTPLNAINSETLITNTQQQYCVPDAVVSTNNSTDFLQLELNATRERLQKQETRVRHLTALLAENEQDLAKLTQMNDMLKEELRRQERSVEREQHMHNSEYVKNVIMKFLTLNNADEKTRLVPVLNTILKLNRNETEMLNCVAKGQKVSETPQRVGGWGNFLPWGNSTNNN
ncbi:hypothetical protein DOY81_008677 [Sarcophaga bullata]|nr:hypothetical protein DOY81_008677 [Sarcophaga bullata]